MEDILYVAVLGGITLTVNTIWGMPADSGEPKAVKAWLLAFVYMLLMGNEASFSCCTNSSSNLASYSWH